MKTKTVDACQTRTLRFVLPPDKQRRVDIALRQRGTTFSAYIRELFDSALVEDCRAAAQLSRVDRLTPPPPMAPPPLPQRGYGRVHKTGLTLAQVFELRKVYLAEGLEVCRVRFGIAATTVRRLCLRTFKPSEIEAIRGDYLPHLSNLRVREELNRLREAIRNRPPKTSTGEGWSAPRTRPIQAPPGVESS